jgi:hypothetical protein
MDAAKQKIEEDLKRANRSRSEEEEGLPSHTLANEVISSHDHAESPSLFQGLLANSLLNEILNEEEPPPFPSSGSSGHFKPKATASSLLNVDEDLSSRLMSGMAFSPAVPSSIRTHLGTLRNELHCTSCYKDSPKCDCRIKLSKLKTQTSALFWRDALGKTEEWSRKRNQVDVDLLLFKDVEQDISGVHIYKLLPHKSLTSFIDLELDLSKVLVSEETKSRILESNINFSSNTMWLLNPEEQLDLIMYQSFCLHKEVELLQLVSKGAEENRLKKTIVVRLTKGVVDAPRHGQLPNRVNRIAAAFRSYLCQLAQTAKK